MAITTDTASETSLQLYTNPLLIQDQQLSLFEEHVFDGRAVLDGNNVFTFGLEMDATMTAGIVNEMVNGFQSLYPARARTMSDLYRHMSDYDYIDMFSTPSGTTVELMLDRDFLINNAPMNQDGADYHKVVLPNHSVFTIGDYKFGIHYPIEIQIRKAYDANGKVDHNRCLFQCQWDTSTPNPLQKLTSNVLEYRIYQRSGLNLLCISIPLEQFSTITKIEDTVSGTGFLKRYAYTNRFYAARVFHYYNGTWTEMSSTLSDVIYNQSSPTAKIKVLSDISTLEVSIPQIYFTNGVIGNRIKTIIYTTVGEMDLDVSTYGPDQFSASFLVNDEVVDDTYSAFLKRVPLMQVVPLSARISNGTNGKTFEEMKNRIINTVGGDDLLVTPAQIQAHLSDIGFTVSKYVDNITDRIYMARKTITNKNGVVIAAGEYKTTISANILANAGKRKVVDGVAKIIGEYRSIRVVDDAATQFVILPSTVFKYDKKTDCMIPLSYTEQNILYHLTTEAFVNEMNNNTYTFTPFHIKLSTNRELPMAGAYDLMRPTMSGITFTNENELTNTQVSLYSYDLTHRDNGTNGYRLTISTFKTNDLKNITAGVLATNETGCRPSNMSVVLRARTASNMLVFCEGTYVGTDSQRDIFTFDINTQYRLTKEDTFDTDAFTPINDYATEPVTGYFNLEHDFELLFFVSDKYIKDPDARNRGAIEPNIPKELRRRGMVWVATQTCRIKFGEPISSLMTSSFVNIKGKTYSTYPTSTFASHVVDIYERDNNGNLVIDESGKLKIKHNAGAIIMSSTDDTLPDLRPPACAIDSVNSDTNIASHSVLYMNPDHLSSNAILSNEWMPFRVYQNKDDNGQYDGTYSAIITGQDHIYTEDLLKQMIDTVDHDASLIVDTPDLLKRSFVRTSTGEYVLEDAVPGEFAYAKFCATSDVSEPMYTIYCDQSTYPASYFLEKYDENDQRAKVIDDYKHFSGVDTDGNPTWQSDAVVNANQYGALYRRDTNRAEFNYQLYVGDDNNLHNFYEAVDNNNGKVSDQILTTFGLSSDIADKLMDFRNPWVKVVEAGHFEIIKAYWNNRIYNNFDMNLLMDGYRGVGCLKLIQSSSDNISTVVPYENTTDAFADVNSATDYHLVWCENYPYNGTTGNADPTVVDGRSEALVENMNIGEGETRGALLWPGSLRAGSSNRGKHYVVITGPSMNICYQRLMSINTFSGIAYMWDSYRYDEDNLNDLESDTNSYCFGMFNGIKHLAKYVLTDHTVFASDTDYYSTDARGLFYLANSFIVPGDVIPPNMYYVREKVKFNNLNEVNTVLYNGIMFNKDNQVDRYINIIDDNINMFESNWNTSGSYWPWETSNWANSTGSSISKLGVTITMSNETDAKLLHQLGDVILDQNGMPVSDPEEDERKLMYRVNMIHVDYKVTQSTDTDYMNLGDDTRELLRGYFERLDATKSQLLERTELYYAPIRSMGYGDFKSGDGAVTSLPLEMTISLRLHVLPAVSGDNDAKETIRKNILSLVSNHVATGVVNCAILAEQIRSNMSDVIQFVDVLGINGDPNVQTLISEDGAAYLPRLKTILVINEDGSIGVDKGLDITWSTIR